MALIAQKLLQMQQKPAFLFDRRAEIEIGRHRIDQHSLPALAGQAVPV
jgi:hypothetical protein